MNTATLKFALKISRKYESDFKASLAYPNSCEHGTYLLTSYDPICGSCEMGYTMSDGVFRRSMALAEAKRRLDLITALGIRAIQLRTLVPGINIDSIIEEMARLREI